jgi:RNA polymerase sigma-70 factor (ECF subfamily)
VEEKIDSQNEDRTLVTRFLLKREESVFRDLYRAHTPALYCFALRILGGRRDDAEEVVQETWIRAVTKLENFRWESSLRSWLCSIVWNHCREVMRKNSKMIKTQSAMQVTISRNIPSSKSDIERAIASLPDGCREILVLHDLEGYTHKEIAESMRISEGTSKSQLFRAREKLRAMLNPNKEVS